MAKKETLKGFQPSKHTSKNEWTLKKGIVLEDHNPHELLADKKFIIEGIAECLTKNDPKGVVEMLDGYRTGMGKKTITFHSEGGTTFTASQIKELTAAARMITKILHPAKTVAKAKQPAKRTPTTKSKAIKHRKTAVVPAKNPTRPAVRVSGKKRATRK